MGYMVHIFGGDLKKYEVDIMTLEDGKIFKINATELIADNGFDEVVKEIVIANEIRESLCQKLLSKNKDRKINVLNMTTLERNVFKEL
jgi:hypothetical protein